MLRDSRGLASAGAPVGAPTACRGGEHSGLAVGGRAAQTGRGLGCAGRTNSQRKPESAGDVIRSDPGPAKREALERTVRGGHQRSGGAPAALGRTIHDQDGAVVGGGDGHLGAVKYMVVGKDGPVNPCRRILLDEFPPASLATAVSRAEGRRARLRRVEPGTTVPRGGF